VKYRSDHDCEDHETKIHAEKELLRWQSTHEKENKKKKERKKEKRAILMPRKGKDAPRATKNGERKNSLHEQKR
jgi:hypothetical protein